MQTKPCSACGLVKPLSDFSPHKRGPLGRQPRCKACCCAAKKAHYHANLEKSREQRRLASKLYSERNPERRRASRQAWKERNPEKDRDSKRAWEARNPEKNAVAKKAWTDANKERNRTTSRAWHAANKDKVREIGKVWRAANQERIRAKSRAWAANNKGRLRELNRALRKAKPEQYAANVRNRRARLRAADGSHTVSDLRDIFRLQKGKCAVCRIKLATYEVDHIQPLSLGGANGRSNLQLLCAPCNRSKNKKPPETFMRERGFLI